MPTDLDDVDTGGENLVFADDLAGTEFQLIDPGVYDADEVTEPGEVPEFGRWLRVGLSEDPDDDAWVVAVGELIEELQRLDEPGRAVVKVTRCEKSGSAQTDPYEVNLEVVETDPQTRLG